MPWLHWSFGRWTEGRQADFEECNALACRHPWARDLNPSNVVVTARDLRIIDYELVDWPPEALRSGIARHIWDFVRIARLPGGGENGSIFLAFGLEAGSDSDILVRRWGR